MDSVSRKKDAKEMPPLLQRFQDYLAKSGLTTGDIVPKETELAEKFGVSRNDIREVIQHFAHLGLLKRIRKRGTILQHLDEESMNRSVAFCLQMGGFYFEEMKEMRLILETAVVPYIISRITPWDLEKLEDNLRQQEKALDNCDRFEELDRQFHAMLLSCCRNRVLSLFTNVLPFLFQKKYRSRFLTRSWTETGYNNHRKLVNALRNHDQAEFIRIITEHIQTT